MRNCKRKKYRFLLSACLVMLNGLYLYGQVNWDPILDLSGPGLDGVKKIISLDDDRFAIAGTFSDSLNWNGIWYTSRGDQDLFVGIYNRENELLNQHFFHSTQSIDIDDFQWDSVQNRMALLGSYRNDIQLGDTSLISPGGNRSLFIRVWSPSSPDGWAISMDSRGLKDGGELAWANDGMLWANGFFGDSLVLGDNRFFSKGNTDVFLFAFSREGQLQTGYTWGGSGNNRARALLKDDFGGLILAGILDDTLELDSDTLAAAIPGDYDLFVLRFIPDSGVAWSIWGGGVLDEEISALEQINENTLLVGGFFSGLLEFDSGLSLQSSSTQPDAFLLQIGPQGNLLSGSSFGGPGNVRLLDLTAYSDRILAVGAFTQQLSIEDQIVESSGQQSGFIAIWGTDPFTIEQLDAIRSDQTVFLETVLQHRSTSLAGGQFAGTLETGLTSYLNSLDPIVLQRTVTTAVSPPPRAFFLLSVYPNPTEGPFQLIQKVACDSFRLISPEGKIIDSGILPEDASWDLSLRPAGTYLLQIRAENRWRTLRVLKK